MNSCMHIYWHNINNDDIANIDDDTYMCMHVRSKLQACTYRSVYSIYTIFLSCASSSFCAAMSRAYMSSYHTHDAGLDALLAGSQILSQQQQCVIIAPFYVLLCLIKLLDVLPPIYVYVTVDILYVT